MSVKAEAWTWTLLSTEHENAVELWRDDEQKITIPLTPDQMELLMGTPKITPFSVLTDDQDGSPC